MISDKWPWRLVVMRRAGGKVNESCAASLPAGDVGGGGVQYSVSCVEGRGRFSQ